MIFLYLLKDKDSNYFKGNHATPRLFDLPSAKAFVTLREHCWNNVEGWRPQKVEVKEVYD